MTEDKHEAFSGLPQSEGPPPVDYWALHFWDGTDSTSKTHQRYRQDAVEVKITENFVTVTNVSTGKVVLMFPLASFLRLEGFTVDRAGEMSEFALKRKWEEKRRAGVANERHYL